MGWLWTLCYQLDAWWWFLKEVLHSLGTCRVFFKPQTIKTYSFSIHCQVLLIFLWDYTSVIRSIIISPKKTFVFLFMNTRKKNLFMSHVATCHFFGIQNTGENETLRTYSIWTHTHCSTSKSTLTTVTIPITKVSIHYSSIDLSGMK